MKITYCDRCEEKITDSERHIDLNPDNNIYYRVQGLQTNFPDLCKPCYEDIVIYANQKPINPAQ